VFDPAGKCPAFVVNPKIARLALEKDRADEREYARLLEGDAPAAPIYSGLDGGMNEVFLGRFPGRIMLAKVMPYASYLPLLPPIPWVDDDGSWTSRWFDTSLADCVRSGSCRLPIGRPDRTALPEPVATGRDGLLRQGIGSEARNATPPRR
jgi:hypothetical protein